MDIKFSGIEHGPLGEVKAIRLSVHPDPARCTPIPTPTTQEEYETAYNAASDTDRKNGNAHQSDQLMWMVARNPTVAAFSDVHTKKLQELLEQRLRELEAHDLDIGMQNRAYCEARAMARAAAHVATVDTIASVSPPSTSTT